MHLVSTGCQYPTYKVVDKAVGLVIAESNGSYGNLIVGLLLKETDDSIQIGGVKHLTALLVKIKRKHGQG